MEKKTKATKRTKSHTPIGQYCVFRAYKIGVRCGKLVGTYTIGAMTYLIVEDSRRLQTQQYASPKGTLDSVCHHGMASGAIVSQALPVDYLDASDVCEIKLCSKTAEANLRGYPRG